MSLPESYGLKDKVTIITGGGQGIGFAIARLFAQAGSDIIIAGRNEKTADGIREIVEAEGRRFFFIKTDVTNEEQVIAMDKLLEFAEVSFRTSCDLLRYRIMRDAGIVKNMDEFLELLN